MRKKFFIVMLLLLSLCVPANSAPYVNRTKNFPYKIDEQDLCYRLFVAHGFEWGGSWDDRKDYQHFEIPTDIVKKLYPALF